MAEPNPMPTDPGRTPLARLRDRLGGAAIAAVSLGVLGVAAWLSPSAQGVGTHTQLGLSSCGFLASTGLPCATCGMTTATALAADGRLLASAATQPAGLLFALGLGCLVWLGGWLAWSGQPAGPVLAGLGRAVFSGRGLLIGGAVIGGAWAYKAARISGVFAEAAPQAASFAPGGLLYA